MTPVGLAAWRKEAALKALLGVAGPPPLPKPPSLPKPGSSIAGPTIKGAPAAAPPPPKPGELKTSAHAHERMVERTDFHPAHVDLIQRAVDTLSLGPGTYHLPLRSQDGAVQGFAQFKSVPNRRSPVLATILGPEMRPGGHNIESMIGLKS